MSLLSLENAVISRVAYDSGSRFTDTLYIGDLDSNGQIGAGGTILKQDRVSIGGDTSDPSSPAGGDVWYRSDLGYLKFYDGVGGTAAIVAHDQTAMAGDLGGTLGNPTVTGIQGQGVQGALADGQVHVYDASAGNLVQTSIAGSQLTRPGWHFSSQSGGLSAWISDSNQINGGFAGDLGTGLGAPGSYLQYDVWLTSGTTWYLILVYAQDSDGSPQVDVTMNGLSLGTTFSCSNPGRNNNQFLEISGITVTNPGQYQIQVVDTDPTPGSNHTIAVSELCLVLA